MCTWHGPVCTPSRRREAVPLASPRGGTTSSRRGSGTMSQRRRRRPRRPPSCRCRPSGLPSAPTGDQRQDALRLRRGSASRTIGLKLTFTSLSAKSCSRQEVEQRRDSCRPSSRRSCRRSRCGTRPATCRMFSMMRSNVPWPPRSGRIRLCVSRSPSSVILTPFSPKRQQPIDDLRRQQQAVGDDADRHA